MERTNGVRVDNRNASLLNRLWLQLPSFSSSEIREKQKDAGILNLQGGNNFKYQKTTFIFDMYIHIYVLLLAKRNSELNWKTYVSDVFFMLYPLICIFTYMYVVLLAKRNRS